VTVIPPPCRSPRCYARSNGSSSAALRARMFALPEKAVPAAREEVVVPGGTTPPVDDADVVAPAAFNAAMTGFQRPAARLDARRYRRPRDRVSAASLASGTAG
jgi:hypothetical protein